MVEEIEFQQNEFISQELLLEISGSFTAQILLLKEVLTVISVSLDFSRYYSAKENQFVKKKL